MVAVTYAEDQDCVQLVTVECPGQALTWAHMFCLFCENALGCMRLNSIRPLRMAAHLKGILVMPSVGDWLISSVGWAWLTCTRLDSSFEQRSNANALKGIAVPTQK